MAQHQSCLEDSNNWDLNSINFSFIVERLSKLSDEDRRKQYFCDETECVKLSDIPTWKEQYTKSQKVLSEKSM